LVVFKLGIGVPVGSVLSDERFWLVRPSRRQVREEAALVWQWLKNSI
jgi:LysR family glycine cleavage system transcriptional activator